MNPLFTRAALIIAVSLAGCDRDNASTPSPAGQTDARPAAADTTRSTPPSQQKAAPELIRGIYVNAYAAGSHKRMSALLAMADRTELNTFVIDVKDERGMRYHSALPLQKQIGGEITIRDLKALADSVHAHKVWAIARVVVFKDPLLSKAKPEWSIRQAGNTLWRDKQGNTWVSAWDPNVWEYNIQIAEEALKAGFDEVQFDYVRFPEAFPSLPPQVHPEAKGDRTDAIVQFLGKAKPRIHALGGIMAADLFGLSPDDPADVEIGQQWERIIAITDHVEPMTYPSHYLPTHLKGIPRPNEMPYETIVASVGMGVIRANRLHEAGAPVARIIPWLQGFSAPWVTKNFPYGPAQAEAQIRGVYDVGLEDWIFWHPGSKYEHLEAAFAKDLAPHAKKFQPTAEMVAQVNLLDRMGAKKAREQALKK